MLTIVDSVRINETDERFVGRPNAVVTSRDGRVFISDAAERKVVVVDADGQNLTTIASRGDGPGEVSSPSSVSIRSPDLLAVKNAGQRRIDMFDLSTLRYRGRWPADFPVTTLTGSPEGFVMGSLQVDSGSAWVSLADSLSTPRRGGSVPAIYRRLPPVAQAFGAIEVGADSTSVYGVFEASNTIYRWSRADGTLRDSVNMVPTVRRGARPDILEQLVRDPSQAAALAFQWSFPLLVAPLSGDRVAVIHYDPTMRGNVYAGPSFLTVVSWNGRRSCADVRLPVPEEAPPRFTISNDTLTGVVQHPSDVDGASTWLVRWRVSPGFCE
jgi:hypothetical protein